MNRGDYLIDDRIKNGAGNFAGEHIHFGQDGYETWNEVIQYLLPDTPPRLQKAFDLMESAHKGQKDKAGFPYRQHPIFVASQLEGESEKIVGLLHDVFEDTDTTLEEVDFLNDEERSALKCITKTKGVDYDAYIQAVKDNPLARAVKIEDLKHNMTDRGYKAPAEKIAKYERSLALLVE